MAASDLLDMLRRHYLPEGRMPAGLFISEIMAPDSDRRADALWCPWTVTGGQGIIGHEIKVSRSDLLAELADPMKAEAWAKYCVRWWLVVSDPALVEGIDLPVTWGVMSPPSGRRRRTMTVIQPAAELKPANTAPAWRRIVAWHDNHVSGRIERLKYDVDHWRREAEYTRSELARREQAGLTRTDSRTELVLAVLAEIDRLRNDGRWFRPATAEAIAAAIVNLDQTQLLARELQREIKWRIDDLGRFAADAEGIAAKLAPLLAGLPAERE